MTARIAAIGRDGGTQPHVAKTRVCIEDVFTGLTQLSGTAARRVRLRRRPKTHFGWTLDTRGRY